MTTDVDAAENYVFLMYSCTPTYSHTSKMCLSVETELVNC